MKVEPEEMTGPSWEEPTSRPLRSEPLGPGGRNLPAAVITAVALVALALITVALRRSPVNKDISPKQSPELSAATCLGAPLRSTTTSASPLTRMNIEAPSSPC